MRVAAMGRRYGGWGSFGNAWLVLWFANLGNIEGNRRMPRNLARLGLSALVLLASLPSLFAADAWLTDLEAAKKQAAAEKKDILVDFTGSDWCGWCIRLKKEVFDQPEFAEASKKFVLVELDFPRGKKQSPELKAKNEALSKQFAIAGFPTILLLDAQGQVYAQTGYQEGGAKQYLAHLDTLSKQNTPEGKQALAARLKQDALEHEIEEQLGPVLEPTLSKKDLAGAEAAMKQFFKAKGLEGDLLVRMTLNVRVGITAECKSGDHDAVLKVVDEIAGMTKSKEVLAEIASLRERVVKVRDQDAERKKTTAK
jgi:thioredoxin-related protein